MGKTIENSDNNFDYIFRELFSSTNHEKQKELFEKIYARINDQLFQHILIEIFPKFYRLERILNFEGTVQDLRQNIFLEIWDDLSEPKTEEKIFLSGYFHTKIKSYLIKYFNQQLHQISLRMEELIDIEANLTLKSMECIDERKPLFLIVKAEYFKLIFDIVGETPDFFARSIFLLRFFLEIPDDILARIVDMNEENMLNIYREARKGFLIKMIENRIIEYFPIIKNLRQINSLDDDKQLQELDGFELYKIRCLEFKDSALICEKMGLSKQEFNLRLMDFFSQLIDEPYNSDYPEEQTIENENILDELLDAIEKKQVLDSKLPGLNSFEKLIVQNFDFLIQMTRIDWEFKKLSQFIEYRLGIESEEELGKFLKDSKLTKEEFENLNNENVITDEGLIRRLEEVLFLPPNYLSGYQ